MRLSALAAALAAVAVSAQSQPPPPPVGEWNFVDTNEVIAVDIEFGAYAAHQAMYREAFASAFANVSDGLTPYVVDFQNSSAGTTLVYFDIILPDYEIKTEFLQIKNLFDVSAPSCAATAPVGCPANEPFARALRARGLPLAYPGAYYNDQLVPHNSSAPMGGPVVASEVGTWQVMDVNEAVVLNIPFNAYAVKQSFYKVAFAKAIAKTLNINADAVVVNDFQASSVGTACLFFDILLPSVTSSSTDSVHAMFQSVASMFHHCHGVGVSPVGCNAGQTSLLVSNLNMFGIPVTDAYYNDQL